MFKIITQSDKAVISPEEEADKTATLKKEKPESSEEIKESIDEHPTEAAKSKKGKGGE